MRFSVAQELSDMSASEATWMRGKTHKQQNQMYRRYLINRNFIIHKVTK